MKNSKTTILKEYPLPCDTEKEGDPYYPITNPSSTEIYGRYLAALKPIPNIQLCGRLAEYKYYNMDAVIESALNCAARVKEAEGACSKEETASTKESDAASSQTFTIAEVWRHVRARSWEVFQTSPKYRAARQVFLYGIIGGLCATLDFCLYLLLSRAADWGGIAGKVFAFFGLAPGSTSGWFQPSLELLYKVHWDIYIPNFASINVGIFTSFILNAVFNFKRTDKFSLRAVMFFMVGYSGLALSMVLLRYGVVVLGYNDWVVKIFSVFFVAALQFTANKFVTFKESKL
jgi:putative flippase GtrA